MSTNVTNISLRVLSNQEYGKRRSFYKRQGYRVYEQWEEYAYNAVMRAIQHNDPSHLNDLIFSSKDMGKYRATCRILKAMNLHWRRVKDTFVTGEKLTAKQKRRRDELVHTWETEYMRAIMAEGIHAAKAPEGWNVEKEIEKELNRVEKRGGNIVDFASALLKAAKKRQREREREQEELAAKAVAALAK